MRKPTPREVFVLFAVCIAGCFATSLVGWYYLESDHPAEIYVGVPSVALIIAVAFFMFRRNKAT